MNENYIYAYILLLLVPERPIEVSVSARTKIGKGKNVSEIFFTSEGGES